MYADNAPPLPVDDGPPEDDGLPPHAAVSSTRPTVMARTPARRGRAGRWDCGFMAASVPVGGRGRATRRR